MTSYVSKAIIENGINIWASRSSGVFVARFSWCHPTGAPGWVPVAGFACLLGHCGPGSLDFRLHGIQIEACASLHGRKLDRRLRQLFDLLLNKHEAPELVFEPIEILLRAFPCAVTRPPRALERIQAKIDQIRHVGFGLVTKPAAWLV